MSISILQKVVIAGLPSLLLSIWPSACQNSSGTTLDLKVQEWHYEDGVLTSVVGVPGQQLLASWQSDIPGYTPIGSVYNIGPSITDGDGYVRTPNGRLNANWYINVTLDPPCLNGVYPDPPVLISSWNGYGNIYNTGNNYGQYTLHCDIDDEDEPDLTAPGFALQGSSPSIITIKSSNTLSTTYGMPQLRVYGNGSTGPLSTVSAISVASDGSSAIFPYPTLSGGGALPANLYAYVIANQTQNGLKFADSHWFSVGGSTPTNSRPFGVDAIVAYITAKTCFRGSCSTSNSVSPYPIVTLYDAGQVQVKSATINVGTHPTVVKAYNIRSTTSTSGYTTTTTTSPQNALVVNTGSNSVSVVSLANNTAIATVAVGTQPVDARISADNSTAYVVNYGSGTVSIINLSNYALTNTVSIGSGPTSLTLDGSGNAWIGGNGFIKQLNLSNLTVTAALYPLGSVIGVGYSAGQHQILAEIAPAGQSSSTSAMSYAINRNYAQADTVPAKSGAYSDYSTSSMSSELLWPSQLSSGVYISQQLNNTVSLTTSGSGFTVTNLESGKSMLIGQAPGVIRGFAVDPNEGILYMTVPDLNEVISVQIPAAISPPSSAVSIASYHY